MFAVRPVKAEGALLVSTDIVLLAAISHAGCDYIPQELKVAFETQGVVSAVLGGEVRRLYNTVPAVKKFIEDLLLFTSVEDLLDAEVHDSFTGTVKTMPEDLEDLLLFTSADDILGAEVHDSFTGTVKTRPEVTDCEPMLLTYEDGRCTSEAGMLFRNGLCFFTADKDPSLFGKAPYSSLSDLISEHAKRLQENVGLKIPHSYLRPLIVDVEGVEGRF